MQKLPLTFEQQQVYNTWLQVTNAQRGVGFRPRKDFDSLSDASYVAVQRISAIFARNGSIKPALYFKAPYLVFKNRDGMFPIEYFTQPAALRTYVQYMKSQEMLPVDDFKQLEAAANGFKFILQFCLQNKIGLWQYTSSTANKLTSHCLQHYRNRDITIYNVVSFDNQMQGIVDMPLDMRELIFVNSDVFRFRQNYDHSLKMKKLCVRAAETVRNTLELGCKTDK